MVKMLFNTCIVLVLLQGIWCLKSLIIKVPEIVKSGDTVTLACNYDLEEAALYTIKWYRNDEEFYRFVPKESPPSRAFTMPYINVDITRSGPIEVTLREVRRELTGLYKCEVSADAPLFHTDIKMAHMTVVDVPNSSPILEIEPEKVEIGKKIQATCYTTGSDPPANITWFINDELIMSTHDDVRIFPTRFESVPNSSREISKSRIEMIANRSFFNTGSMILKCKASVYTIWNKFKDGLVKDETPVLAPVLLSTSSQTHDNDDFDFFGRSESTSFLPLIPIYIFILLYIILHR